MLGIVRILLGAEHIFRACLAAKNTSDAAHNTTSSTRRYVAVTVEMPIPVPRARYIAKHAGHFGRTVRTAVGTKHPAISKKRRLTVLEAQQWAALTRNAPVTYSTMLK